MPAPKNFMLGVETLKKHLKTMPSSAGVYRMVGAAGNVLYVGKAKNLKKRVTSYTQENRLPMRLIQMVALTRDLEIITTRTESEALLLEANLIQKFMPPYNILLRDDKSYPYIFIPTDHDFPSILKHRGAKNRRGHYFGPFASAGAVRETLTLLQRGFMVRNCSDSYFAGRKRPCLQYHIKRCTAPCVNKVSKDAYSAQVGQAVAFLKGNSSDIQKQTAIAMQAASARRDFETAASLRDRIKLLTAIQAKQDMDVNGLGDADVIALAQAGDRTAIQIFFYRGDKNYGSRVFYPKHTSGCARDEILANFIAQFYHDKSPPTQIYVGEVVMDAPLLARALTEQAGQNINIIIPRMGNKKRLVDNASENASTALARHIADEGVSRALHKHLAEIFKIPTPPKRIEVYDNSHISGQFAVGAMIVANEEGFIKKAYRKFNIARDHAGDDYAMMEEVLRRRLGRLVKEQDEGNTESKPDLIIIDGGLGQLNKAIAVMNDLGIDNIALVAIAKGADRHAGRERFFMQNIPPFRLPENDATLYYLQRLRDEAHRFAIGTHRAKRARAIGTTRLDEIAGIGATRKHALLNHFGSAKAVESAGIEELCQAPNINESTAKKIYDYFHA